VFVQIKTNAWPPTKPIIDFMKHKRDIKVISVNVFKKKSRWDIKVREYYTSNIFNNNNIKGNYVDK